MTRIEVHAVYELCGEPGEDPQEIADDLVCDLTLLGFDTIDIEVVG